jgi:hypothetical protein
MDERKALSALVGEGIESHEERKEAWILAGKPGERPTIMDSIADHLFANGVVVREKGEWLMNRDGSCTCKKCRRTTKDAWDFDGWLNFCPNCGEDKRKGKGG